ncbi:MFS transporter [Thiotrichales bacterium 19S11-10]|nr:MFS transporter [Thiotrichales bacterium 19S11-10]
MEQINQLKRNSLRIVFLASITWFVAALFYGLEFFQRVSPAVISTDLSNHFQIPPAELGSIMALYFYAYAIAQLPVGTLIDRYGARLCLSIACLVLSIGVIIFATTEEVWVLALGRIIVGIGSAFAFIGTLKLARLWFSTEVFPFIVGLTNTLGVLGAIIGSEPLAYLMQSYGWQKSLIASGIIGIILSIMIYLVIRNRPPNHSSARLDSTKNSVSMVLNMGKIPSTWLLGLYAGLMVASVISFAELWSVPFLDKAYPHLSQFSSQVNEFIFIGIAVGGPLNGILSGLLSRRKTPMYMGTVGTFICFILIILQIPNQLWLLELIYFLFGFFVSSMLICFAIATDIHSAKLSGILMSWINMLIVLIGAFFQPLIGFLIQYASPIQHSTISAYSLGDFIYAISSLPAALVIALILLFFIPETYAKHLNQEKI